MSEQTKSKGGYGNGGGERSEQVSYYYRKRWFVAALVTCALITTGCLLNVEYRGHRWVSSFILSAPLILITFALLCVVLSNTTTLVVGKAGVILPTLSKTWIPWSEISDVRAVDEKQLPWIHFEIENLDRYPVLSANPFARILRAFDDYPERVLTSRLNASRDEILAVIARFRDQAASESSSRR